MSEVEIKVSCINLADGKVRWVDNRTLKELLTQDNWKLFPNPEKDYYYEYDGNLNEKLGQEAKPIPATTDFGGEEVLEVFQL